MSLLGESGFDIFGSGERKQQRAMEREAAYLDAQSKNQVKIEEMREKSATARALALSEAQDSRVFKREDARELREALAMERKDKKEIMDMQSAIAGTVGQQYSYNRDPQGGKMSHEEAMKAVQEDMDYYKDMRSELSKTPEGAKTALKLGMILQGEINKAKNYYDHYPQPKQGMAEAGAEGGTSASTSKASEKVEPSSVEKLSSTLMQQDAAGKLTPRRKKQLTGILSDIREGESRRGMRNAIVDATDFGEGLLNSLTPFSNMSGDRYVEGKLGLWPMVGRALDKFVFRPVEDAADWAGRMSKAPEGY